MTGKEDTKPNLWSSPRAWRVGAGVLGGSSRTVAVASVVAALLTRYVLDLAVARGIGPAAYGDYALMSAIALATASVAALGLPEQANRQLPLLMMEGRGKASVTFLRLGAFSSLGVGTLLGVCAAVTMSSFSGLGTSSAAVTLVLLVPAAALFTFRRQQVLLCGSPLLGLFAPALMSGAAATLVVAAAVVFEPVEAVHALVIVAGAYLLLSLVTSLNGRVSDHRAGVGADAVEVKSWIRSSLAVLSSNLATLLMSFMDILLVALFFSRVDTGIYAAASRLALLVTLALAGLIPREGPIFGRLLAAGDLATCRREFLRACAVSGVLGLVTLAVLAAGGKFFLALFGGGFSAGYAWLCLLALGRCVSAATGPAALLLIVIGQPRRAAAGAWLGLVAGLVLMLALAPSLGTLGIAAGAASGMAVRTLVQFGLAMRSIRSPGNFGTSP